MNQAFDYPVFLWGFAALLPFVFFNLLGTRKAGGRMPSALMRRLFISTIFFDSFLAFLIIALAGPRWGSQSVSDGSRRGLDVVIALDVSRSMNIRDATLVTATQGAAGFETAGRPEALGYSGGEMGASRLERGLSLSLETVAALPEMRYAVAVGRGRGLLAVPLTWDKDAVLNFLEAAGSETIGGAGTNLESLLDAAVQAFVESFPSRRLILLVSDGEALSGSLKAALARLNQKGISVSALALGSAEGRPVPGLEGVISRRESGVMRMIAESTGGIYIDGNRDDAFAALAGHLRSLVPETQMGEGRVEKKQRWFLFLAAAIICYAASRFCFLKKIKLKALSALCLLLACSCKGTSGKLLVMEGNYLASQGRHTEAIVSYHRALAHEGAAPYAESGLGTVYFSIGENAAALDRFDASLKLLESSPPADNRELRYRNNYNSGVILFAQGDFPAAAEAFRQALRVDPGRIEAKRNLELSLLSIAREKSGKPVKEAQGETETESRQVLFEYMRQKEQNQWKSREWAEEEENNGPDY
jgi:Ca-activated chloride channel family protein